MPEIQEQMQDYRCPAPPLLPCAVRAPGGCASAGRSCTLRVSAQDAAHPGPGQPVWGERPAAAGRGPGPRAPSGRAAAGRPGRHSVSPGPSQPDALPGRHLPLHLPPGPPSPHCTAAVSGAFRARGSGQEALTAVRGACSAASQPPVCDELHRAAAPPEGHGAGRLREGPGHSCRVAASQARPPVSRPQRWLWGHVGLRSRFCPQPCCSVWWPGGLGRAVLPVERRKWD